MIRAALVQLNASDDPAENLTTLVELYREAHGRGAEFVLTPEVSNCVSASRAHQDTVLQLEEADQTLAGLCREARSLGTWLLVGSLALKTDDPDGRFTNRSFMISPNGEVVARYDKIHMFDVEISQTESYQESAGYRPGNRAVIANTAIGRVGMTVCYDVRFPGLYRRLAQAGAEILTVPSAFATTTGAAHWETLLRARAIETGSYVLAPAQTGTHRATTGKQRSTHGHSLAVSPWGEVIADGGTSTGVTLVDIDLSLVKDARNRIPSIRNDRSFGGPET